MHWFWRAAIALIPGGLLSAWIFNSLFCRDGFWWTVEFEASQAYGPLGLLALFALLVLPMALYLGTYRLLKWIGLRLCTLLAGVSVLACLLMSLLWLRSCWYSDEAELWMWDSHVFKAESAPGYVWLSAGIGNAHSFRPFFFDYGCGLAAAGRDELDELYEVAEDGSLPISFHWGGFMVLGDQSMPRVIVTPYWFPIVLLGGFARLMIRRVRSVRTRDRTARGQCGRCGYNLTGNTSGTCPECGAPVPGRASTSPGGGVD
jgi:hypothetical protein